MSKSQNRHYTIKWKKKRKSHNAAKCNIANCYICHSDKLLKIPDKQLLIANSKLKEDDR
jgi:hypothetical protein